LHFLIAFLCRSHELCEPEVRISVKRDLIHSQKRPTMNSIPEVCSLKSLNQRQLLRYALV